MVIFLRGRSRQSSWAPAQVQCLIVVNVGAGAEGGESPGTSQSVVATLSPWLLPALLFMPTSLVTVRVKFLLPPVCALCWSWSHTEDTYCSRCLILLILESSICPHSFLLLLVTMAGLLLGEHTHMLSPSLSPSLRFFHIEWITGTIFRHTIQ